MRILREKSGQRSVTAYKNQLKNTINNWKSIDENVLKVFLTVNRYSIIIIAGYTPLADEKDAMKQELSEGGGHSNK